SGSGSRRRSGGCARKSGARRRSSAANGSSNGSTAGDQALAFRGARRASDVGRRRPWRRSEACPEAAAPDEGGARSRAEAEALRGGRGAGEGSCPGGERRSAQGPRPVRGKGAGGRREGPSAAAGMIHPGRISVAGKTIVSTVT